MPDQQAEQAGVQLFKERFQLVPFLKQLSQQFKEDRVSGLAQEVAYNMTFAIPPLIVLLFTLAGLTDKLTGIPIASTLHDVIANRAPGEAKQLLDTMVTNTIQKVGAGALSFGLIVSVVLALYGGSGGIGSLIESFNIAYEVKEERSFFKQFLLRIGLTLLLGISIILAFVLFVFGHRIGDWIAGRVGLGHVFTLTWNIARWPVALLVIMFLLALLYYFGPNVDQSFRWISPGSVVATILWVVALLGFKLYLAVSNPGSSFGVAGGAIVLLFFLYVTGIVFILGAEINAVLAKRYDAATVEDLATHPEKTTPQMHQKATQRARRMGAQGGQPAPAHASNAGPTPPRQDKQSGGSKLWSLAAASIIGAYVVEKLVNRGKGKSKS